MPSPGMPASEPRSNPAAQRGSMAPGKARRGGGAAGDTGYDTSPQDGATGSGDTGGGSAGGSAERGSEQGGGGGEQGAGSSGSGGADVNGPPHRVTTPEVQHVQGLIERCMTQYLPQDQVVRLLQSQAGIEPAVTKMVWAKLEERNPKFFAEYRLRSKLKEQVVMFNYLLEQQMSMVNRLFSGWVSAMPPGMPPPGGLPPMGPPPSISSMLPPHPMGGVGGGVGASTLAPPHFPPHPGMFPHPAGLGGGMGCVGPRHRGGGAGGAAGKLEPGTSAGGLPDGGWLAGAAHGGGGGGGGGAQDHGGGPSDGGWLAGVSRGGGGGDGNGDGAIKMEEQHAGRAPGAAGAGVAPGASTSGAHPSSGDHLSVFDAAAFHDLGDVGGAGVDFSLMHLHSSMDDFMDGLGLSNIGSQPGMGVGGASPMDTGAASMHHHHVHDYHHPNHAGYQHATPHAGAGASGAAAEAGGLDLAAQLEERSGRPPAVPPTGGAVVKLEEAGGSWTELEEVGAGGCSGGHRGLGTDLPSMGAIGLGLSSGEHALGVGDPADGLSHLGLGDDIGMGLGDLSFGGPVFGGASDGKREAFSLDEMEALEFCT
ncbi:hypothetical protein FOA52_013643 [Chlamydomonas sp. UWO 241]|nr:hypothetical protein FOA52_013643 [Chlamydomonas sp. UWO 241]